MPNQYLNAIFCHAIRYYYNEWHDKLSLPKLAMTQQTS